jgi:multisubunit Na+/H+ antiporter MnhE subunit
MALLRRAVAWCLWFTAMFWWWMLLSGEWDHEEWISAAAAAALVATVGESARRVAELDIRVPLERLTQLPLALAMVVADFLTITWVLVVSAFGLRPFRGRFIHRRASFDTTGLDAEGATRRGLTILIAGYSPNAYVIDVDRKEETVLVHDLVTRRKSEEPA